MSTGIGGYFQREALSAAGAICRPRLHRYDAARSAFAALLQAGRPERVWMPWFQCPAMPAQARRAGVQVMNYGLARSGAPAADLRPQTGDWIVLVDYFGMRSAQVQAALAHLPAQCVILDQAQAWYAPVSNTLATIYSPRKFVGLPDGGLLATRMTLPAAPRADESASQRRLRALGLRAQGRRAEGLAAYREAEASLDDAPGSAMSNTTAALLDRLDFETRGQRRLANFRHLAAMLDASNALEWSASPEDVPLCYPFLAHNAAALRDRLRAAEVFTARYWPGIEGAAPGWEAALVEDLLCLPVDHRYGDAEMDRIASLLLS